MEKQNDTQAARVDPNCSTAIHVVRLQSNCWLADLDGDPGRTLVLKNAKEFATFEDAKRELDEVQKYRKYPGATIDQY